MDIASWILAGAVLTGALVFELLPALLSGLLMHQLARMLAGRIKASCEARGATSID